jgi:hypothetical protein
MDIHTLASQSGDSHLVGYTFTDGRLAVVLRVPELSESRVCVTVPTDRVYADVPADDSSPYRTCFVELAAVDQHVDVNADGIIVPSADFGSLMRQVRGGFGLTFGLRIRNCPYLLRFLGSRPLVACIVRDQHDIQCAPCSDESSEPNGEPKPPITRALKS